MLKTFNFIYNTIKFFIFCIFFEFIISFILIIILVLTLLQKNYVTVYCLMIFKFFFLFYFLTFFLKFFLIYKSFYIKRFYTSFDLNPAIYTFDIILTLILEGFYYSIRYNFLYMDIFYPNNFNINI